MTDHADLIRRLLHWKETSIADAAVRCEAVNAIRELVADYKGQGEALIREVNAKLEAQMRAEKAESDLAAARAALLYFANSLSEFHGDEHHDDGCPDCLAMVEHAPAIAAARDEEKADG